mmetsp:Transcript_417/g.1135  ORF Transcript_417/g.1135 Transcript_417/m.1135 type:complete len:442 (-) Transcript_417:7-1332(-)
MALQQLGVEVVVLAKVDAVVWHIQNGLPAVDIGETVAVGPLPDVLRGHILVHPPHVCLDARVRIANAVVGCVKDKPARERDAQGAPPLHVINHRGEIRRRVHVVIVKVCYELPGCQGGAYVPLEANAPVVTGLPLESRVDHAVGLLTGLLCKECRGICVVGFHNNELLVGPVLGFEAGPEDLVKVLSSLDGGRDDRHSALAHVGRSPPWPELVACHLPDVPLPLVKLHHLLLPLAALHGHWHLYAEARSLRRDVKGSQERNFQGIAGAVKLTLVLRRGLVAQEVGDSMSSEGAEGLHDAVPSPLAKLASRVLALLMVARCDRELRWELAICQHGPGHLAARGRGQCPHVRDCAGGAELQLLSCLQVGLAALGVLCPVPQQLLVPVPRVAPGSAIVDRTPQLVPQEPLQLYSKLCRRAIISPIAHVAQWQFGSCTLRNQGKS